MIIEALRVVRAGPLARQPFLGEIVKQDHAAEPAEDRINVIVNALEDADWIPQLGYRRAQVTQLQEKPVTNPHDFFEIETTSAEQA